MDFEYKKELKDKSDLDLWKNGFYSNYSREKMVEDFCEFSELIFEPRKAKLLLEHYPALDRKFAVWLRVYQKIDVTFFTREQLLSKNALAQKQNQPPIIERDKLLELKKGTYFHLPTLKPYSGKTVNFRTKKKIQKKYETLYREGEEVSESWFWYHKEGRLKQKAVYQNDKKVSTAFFHPNGKNKTRHTYKAGKLDGPSTWWYDNGQKESEAIYRDGKVIQDTIEHWNRDGTPK